LICGTLNPTSGSISTFGRVAALLELGSGFNPEFTGRENVYMNGAVLGLTKEQIDERYDAIVSFADIGDFIHQPVKSYSSGMMVRLAFAVIAHVDADILIIDEALAVGDAFFTQKCMRFLRTFMENGTVLFVSHDTASIRSLCNKAIWLDKGVVLQSGEPKEVCELYLEAFYEAQQGKSATARINVEKKVTSVKVARDQRLDFINATNLRNDLRLFDFNPGAASFGKGHASITNVQFFDIEGYPLVWVVGGEEVNLVVEAKVDTILVSPIIGFSVKDRLGQVLFSENTFLRYIDETIVCESNELITAEFRFFMPRLPSGDYSVNVAIATGTQDDHVQHHWIHDAIHFRSESTSVASGLVGIPMTNIELKKSGN
jgi:lipopolysaccharide transport system ATP-binding protein